MNYESGKKFRNIRMFSYFRKPRDSSFLIPDSGKSSGFTQHHFSSKSGAGFTLIEVIIVVVFISLVASLGLSIGIDVYRSSSLASEKDLIVSALERARSLATTNAGGMPHGVYIEDDKHTIFRGASFAARDTTFDQAIGNASLITATGTIEFVFEQLSGDGLATGTLTMTDDRGVSRTISVNEEGGLDW